LGAYALGIVAVRQDRPGVRRGNGAGTAANPSVTAKGDYEAIGFAGMSGMPADAFHLYGIGVDAGGGDGSSVAEGYSAATIAAGSAISGISEPASACSVSGNSTLATGKDAIGCVPTGGDVPLVADVDGSASSSAPARTAVEELGAAS